MKTFADISSVRDALMDYRADHLSKLPEALQTKFKEQMSSPSPVDQIVGTMELLYANRGELDDAGKELVGGLAAFATVNAWHGLTEDERGSKIVQAMGRDLGEKPIPGFKFPAEDQDPAGLDRYLIKDDQPLPVPSTPAAPVDKAE